MADSTETVAVESAASASTSAMIAVDAAVAAENAVQEIREIAVDAIVSATVTNAEQAVQIANNAATLATQEAALMVTAAAESVAAIERGTEWQGEAIQRLQTESVATLTTLQSLTAEVEALKAALLLLTAPTQTGSSQSIPPTSEAVETVTATTAEATSSETKMEPSPSNAEESQGRKMEARKRVLRFL